jgi:ABC-2 type transport system ATP-binding protein
MDGSQEPVLVADRLVRRFGDLTAVDGVSLSIAPGETYGLLGPNGAGKTTTISMICGLLEADAGSVTVQGQPMTTGSTGVKSALGLVPQDVALYPDLSARDNLRFFGKLQGLSGRVLDARIAEVLEVVGLSERAKDRVETYSGGMKRRANIAAGLLHQPQLLVLDEPTVGVDPQSRNAILESIDELGGKGLAVLYTTHYMEEAERLCDRIGIIDEGRLVAEGTRDALVAMVGADTTVTLTATPSEGVDAAAAMATWAQRCRALDGVEDVQATKAALDLVTREGSALVAAAVMAADDLPLAVTAVEVNEPNLETVFLHLTGKALRD